MSVFEEKRALRTKYLAAREALFSEEACGRIAERFLLSPYAACDSFFVYLSFGKEAETRPLVGELFRRGKTVCVPRLAGKEMLSVLLAGAFGKNRFGIEEPCAGGETTCDAAVVPLLAVDGAGYRLGYGGGYYDRYFARHPEVLRVGICFAGQVVLTLPRETGDVPLDAVVTEKEIMLFGRTPYGGDSDRRQKTERERGF